MPPVGIRRFLSHLATAPQRASASTASAIAPSATRRVLRGAGCRGVRASPCVVGRRLAIAPDVQGRGIGSKLLRAVEERSKAAESELFTGSLSEANLRLYRREGYVETERVLEDDGIEQVFLRKRLR